MKRNKIKGITGKQHPKNLDLLGTQPKVASVAMASHHEVDPDEHHVDDNESDDETEIS